MRKLSKNKVLEQFKKIHGDKYNYSKVNYINTNTKIEIICPDHGSFFQTPANHKQNHGCPECKSLILNKIFKSTKNKLLQRFKKVHKDKYDYSKLDMNNYKNTRIKIEIICPKHGSFFQTPAAHGFGSGCPKCNKWKIKKQPEVLEQFKKIHGNRYNYSKVEYKNNNTKIEIICSVHGSFFQTPLQHKLGAGCIKCSKLGYSVEKVLEQFKKIHGNKYNYLKVHYINNHTKIEIICPKHGSFFQTPSDHKMGSGCPKCSESKGERKIREFLEENNITYEREVKLFKNYRFDFYLEELNLVIEYDGIQHFEPVEFFGGEEGLSKTQERDRIKEEYCLENNIRIIRIIYKEFNNINKILKDIN